MPSSSVTVTADYGAAISFSANPAAGGNPACASGANPCWVDYGSNGNLRTNTNSGYTFSDWTCTGAGCYAGTTGSVPVTVYNPMTETANYASSSTTSTTSTTTASSSWYATCVSAAGTDTCNGSTGTYYETSASSSECPSTDPVQKIHTSCYISGGSYYYTVGYSDGGTEKSTDFCGAYSPSDDC